MQIPSGDSFGNRNPQLRQTNLSGSNNNGSALMSSALKGFSSELSKLQHVDKSQGIDQLDGENELFDYQAQLDNINVNVADLFARGEISDREMALQHQKSLANIKQPTFANLDKPTQKQFLLEKKKLEHSNKLAMATMIMQAQKERAKTSNIKTLEHVKGIVNSGNVSPSGAIELLNNNDGFQKTGEFAFGLDWAVQKMGSYQQVQMASIEGGIQDANNSGNVEQLKNIKGMLNDDNGDINYLTPLMKNKYVKQINGFIDVNIGRSFAKVVEDGSSQLFDKMGNFSAINAYGLLNNMQGDAVQDGPEKAKYIASQIGVTFDQQQFNESPQYVEQLQQAYFNQSLDQYGSPALAAISTQVGYKQMNSWLKEFGDPSKDQLSEADFISKIPDNQLKQTALQISQQEDSYFNMDDMLALVDGNKSLNDEQKRIAKSSVKKFMLEKQQTIDEQYQQNHQTIWNQLYVQGMSVNQINANQWCALSESDRKQLLEKTPPTQLNFQMYQEARGRVMAGKPIDLVKDYYDKVPGDQLKELIDLQENIKNDPTRRDGVIKTSALINSRIEAASYINEKNRYILNASITDEVESFEKKHGRVATQKEILEITDRQFVLMRLDDGVWFDTKKPYYQMTKDERKKAKVFSVSAIPQKELRRIKDALKVRNLSESDENVLEAFNRRLRND